MLNFSDKLQLIKRCSNYAFLRAVLVVFCLTPHITSHGFVLFTALARAGETQQKKTCSAQELTSLLKSLLDSKPERSRTHPDLILGSELNDGLRVGDTVYLDLAKGLRSKSLSNSATDTIEAQVVSVSRNEESDYFSRIDYRFRLYDGREVSLKVGDLYGNVYRHPQFRLHAPFAKDEWVVIGRDGGSDVVGSDVADPSRTITITPPYLAKFLRPDGVDHYQVKIENALNGTSHTVRIRSYDILGTPTGTELAAKALIERTNSHARPACAHRFCT